MKKILFFILIISVVSCETCKQCKKCEQDDNFSNLVIESKCYNHLIKNRIPHYGFTGRDGCVVKKEISMNITKLNKGTIKGKVCDSETNNPIVNAYIHLIVNRNNKEEIITIISNDNGNYKSNFKGMLTKIIVGDIDLNPSPEEYTYGTNYYRALVVDLKDYK